MPAAVLYLGKPNHCEGVVANTRGDRGAAAFGKSVLLKEREKREKERKRAREREKVRRRSITTGGFHRNRIRPRGLNGARREFKQPAHTNARTRTRTPTH